MADMMGGEATSGVGALASTAVAGAQGFMNPLSDITAVAGLVGFGMSIFGTNKAAKDSAQIAADQSGILSQDEDINKWRQQQATLEAQRSLLQNVRQSQVANATSLSRTVNQTGSAGGSALPGSRGQTQGQAGTNALGITQNLQIADNIFGDMNTIDTYKMQIAALTGNMNTNQGLAQIGNAIGQGAGTIGKSLYSLGASGQTAAQQYTSSFGNTSQPTDI